MAAKKGKAASFEDRMQEIERLTETLQSSGLGLAEALEAYERGMETVRVLRAELDAYEKRIEQINYATGETEPFEEKDDAV